MYSVVIRGLKAEYIAVAFFANNKRGWSYEKDSNCYSNIYLYHVRLYNYSHLKQKTTVTLNRTVVLIINNLKVREASR
jgi:hypothetical protein